MDTADSASTGKDRARTRTGKRTAPRTQRASMADVARLAGVSSQTVSRVSNGYEGVTEETRQQVLAAMNELGYRPNSAARALKRGEFRTIGVITFNLSTTGNMRTLEAIATSAAQEGYAVTLLPVAVPTQDEVRGAFSRLGELAVDAVIVIMEVHLLDAATISLPPHVQVVVADSDAGDRYTVVDTDQAGEPVLLCGTCWTSAIARSGIWPVPRSPLRRNAVPMPGAQNSPGRAASCRASYEATGRRSRAIGQVCNSPTRRTVRRCSPPTTRWRWGFCGPCTSEAGRFPMTSASSASTTSPSPAPSCLR